MTIRTMTRMCIARNLVRPKLTLRVELVLTYKTRNDIHLLHKNYRFCHALCPPHETKYFLNLKSQNRNTQMLQQNAAYHWMKMNNSRKLNFHKKRRLSTDSPESEDNNEHPLNLTSFKLDRIKLDFGTTLKNFAKSLYLKYNFDKSFDLLSFNQGATQAIVSVSNSISQGKFDELEGLVDSEAIEEIRENYSLLSEDQKKIIAVKPDDIFLRYIRYVDIESSKSGEKIARVTSVFMGFPGFAEVKQYSDERTVWLNANKYTCIYRFRKGFTTGEQTDWKIETLNHNIVKLR